jgi:hypothetical protein
MEDEVEAERLDLTKNNNNSSSKMGMNVRSAQLSWGDGEENGCGDSQGGEEESTVVNRNHGNRGHKGEGIVVHGAVRDLSLFKTPEFLVYARLQLCPGACSPHP